MFTLTPRIPLRPVTAHFKTEWDAADAFLEVCGEGYFIRQPDGSLRCFVNRDLSFNPKDCVAVIAGTPEGQ